MTDADQSTEDRQGGYDDGYRACPCFWGTEPGSLLVELDRRKSISGLTVLDIGCGEGKNAAWLADRNCEVDAVEISEAALRNARRAFPASPVNWIAGDVRKSPWGTKIYDLVVAYGLLHCVDEGHVPQVVHAMKAATRPGGWNILVAFNDRSQDLSAHPNFKPTLVAHQDYLDLYGDWTIVLASDTDLHETHPHNGIPHHHSMSRLLAKKPRG